MLIEHMTNQKKILKWEKVCIIHFVERVNGEYDDF